MKTRIQKWGNSLALRIPGPFARETAVRAGAIVELSVVDGKLVVTPLGRERPTLRRLLAGVTRSNRHHEIDSGAPIGRESW
jgi:antitoxin MazE